MYANFMDISNAVHTPWRTRIPLDNTGRNKARIAPADELVLDALEEILGLLTPPRMNLVSAGILPPGFNDSAVDLSNDEPIVKRTPDIPIESLPYAHGYRVGWNAAIDKILNDITVSLSIEAIEHLGQMRRD